MKVAQAAATLFQVRFADEDFSPMLVPPLLAFFAHGVQNVGATALALDFERGFQTVEQRPVASDYA
ncbi:hypothetical protein WAJ71_19940, partial [Acinetobacter baumannii]